MGHLEKPAQPEKTPLVPSTRLTLALAAFVGILMIYACRVNLSVALVCMVNQTAIKQGINQSALTETPSMKLSDQGTLVWPKTIQGTLLGAFFYGYIVTQVIGGWLAERVGAKRVLAVTALGGAICTMLSHVGAELHYIVLLILRVILGACQGVTFPAFHAMWSRWAPPLERSTLVGLSYAGAQIGMVITLPFSAFLCDYGFAGGWPSIFYILGAVMAVWVIMWMLIAADYPSTHPRISPRERSYIIESLSDQVDESAQHGARKTPWRSVLTSPCVWACVVGHFAGDWGAYMMLTSLPMFMNDVLKFDMTSLGMIASLPYIAYFITINVGGIIADWLRASNIMSTVNTRRLAMVTALGGQAIFLILVGYTRPIQLALGFDNDDTSTATTLAVIFLILGVGLSGFQYAGWVVNYMDIAPSYAGTIFGIGNTVSSVAGMLAPVVMGAMTPNGTADEWRSLFYVTAAIMIAGTTIFFLFARGTVQPWAEINSTEMKLIEETPMLDTKIVNGTTENNKPLDSYKVAVA